MNTFETHNELEEKLFALQTEKLAFDQFINELMTSQLFMPVRDDETEIQGFQKSSQAKPLTLTDEEGTEVLILFSSPERAKDFLPAYPGYSGGLLTDFGWVLERLGSGIGIAINPGLEVGIDFDPDMVAQLIHLNKTASGSTTSQ